MKSKSKSSRVARRYGMIEQLESRIAPAAVISPNLPLNPKFVTASVGTSLLVKAGDVLTTGTAGGGSYLLYVQSGQILVHTTDLNGDGQVDPNDITGISAGNGARFILFVDVHGDIVTDLNSDGTLTDGGKGDILLDNNIAGITLRSLTTGDFAGSDAQTAAQLVNAHLAMSSYSIYGNIYAGAGLGLSTDTTSGLHIDTSGEGLQATKFTGGTGTNFYQPTEPVIGSIYAGSSATGQAFSFGNSGSLSDVHGNLLAFNPAPGEAGASIYNISAASSSQPFSIGTIEAGNGGFNAPGGSVVNVALQGDNAGVYKLIAGNAGQGTAGQPGGSIVNFSDTGSIISEVVLQSGSGGNSLTGVGGNAGNITFNPAIITKINAHFVLNYGNGGDGYNGGGNGGGTPSGTLTTPEGKITTPLTVVSTWHPIGTIGSTTPFDFNGDGFSDAVFSTTNPDQLVVALGNQSVENFSNFQSEHFFGLDSANYIYLNSPAQVDSIVVGDFTGAVNPVTHQPELDIAVASGQNSLAGIEVYVSEYNPKTGAFEGFSDPLFSPLPALTELGFYNTPVSVVKLVGGDFQGNGTEQLAVVANDQGQQQLIFLTAETDATHPLGTGYFFANMSQAGNQVTPITEPNLGPASVQDIYLPTALQTYTRGSGHDVIVQSIFGNDLSFSVYADVGGGTPNVVGGGGFNQIDTNRALGGTNIALTNFVVQAMTVIQDPTTPNLAAVVALSQPPNGFLETFHQPTMMTGNFVNFVNGSGSGDNAGIDIYGTISGAVGIVTVPNSMNPAIYSSVGVLSYGAGDFIGTFDIVAGVNNKPDTAPSVNVYETNLLGANNAVVAFDAYYPHPTFDPNVPSSGPGQVGFITANPGKTTGDQQLLSVSEPEGNGSFGGEFLVPFKVAGYFFNGGNGGNSVSGAGGAGGGFGQTLTVTGSGTSTVGTGTLNVEFPMDQTYEGYVRFVAGNGGNGFTAGGAGGSISGISITYPNATPVLTDTALLVAGNGGESLTGVGGAGGSLSQLFIESGEYFVAGNGGIGVVGGAGGSIIGNLQPGALTASSNNLNPDLLLKGGDGATGIAGGGNGGTINGFVDHFNPFTTGVGGELSYIAGNAGNAVAGHAGTGGSIINCSPFALDNNLAGDISLQGGTGGTGLFGGNGGSIINFDQSSTIPENPTSATIFSGAGGNSTLGVAGAGGNITAVDVVASASPQNPGTFFTFNFSNPALVLDPFGLGSVNTAAPVTYNRMVAGAGGLSMGGTGGAGGSISNVNYASTAGISQVVLAAGAGGNGLNAGGAGGSVISATVDAGAQGGNGKAVVIAGDGGASFSVAPATTAASDVANAIGAVNGPGGAGGSVQNVAQTINVNCELDVIAGNGGATLAHGVLSGNATTDNSGHGGSVLNVTAAGNIGNTSSTVALKSYNNILQGQTMQDFIDNFVVGNISGLMTDSIGSVGLVAGAAGSTEGGQISTDGINGSVSNVHAENIASMIAGNVEQVAPIQSLTNYGSTLNSNFILGAYKTVYYDPFTNTDQTTEPGTTTPIPLGTPNFISGSGVTQGLDVNTPLPGGGILIDGALWGLNIRKPLSNLDFVGTD